MAKKVMIICGSPRPKGNTVTVANWVARGAREAEAEVEMVDAVKIGNKNNGCVGCRGCQESDEYRCVVNDETSEVVVRMLEQDVVVFATPVYFAGFSAQMKRLIDRMYCLIKAREGSYSVAPELEGISLALIATAGGDVNFGMGLVSRHFKALAAALVPSSKELLVPFAPATPGDIAANTQVQARAMAFGKELAS